MKLHPWEREIVWQAREILADYTRKSDALTSPEAVKSLAVTHLSHLGHEVFCALWLDTKHRLIEFEHMFRGTIDGASVYPRTVVESAIRHNAAAVIFAHNHPSGVAEPSVQDQSITRRLKSALALIDIRVLDHIIVGNPDITSFSERGLM